MKLDSLKSIIAACAVILMVTACGGGGDSAPQGVTYQGQTAAAAITATNAENLALDSYRGGSVADGFGGITAVQQVGTNNAHTDPVVELRAPQVADTVNAAIAQAFARQKHLPQSPVGVTVSSDIVGLYGGSFSYTLTVNDISGNFFGRLTFSSFRGVDQGVVLNGAVNVTGTYSFASQSIPVFAMDFVTLTVFDGLISNTMTGFITWNSDLTSITVNVSVVLRNNSTGFTYWVNNFNYTYAGSALTISGRYYDPVHGYIVVSTPVTLTVPAAAPFSGKPTFGTLRIEGRTPPSALFPCSAELDFTQSGYEVWIDPEGDGLFVLHVTR